MWSQAAPSLTMLSQFKLNNFDIQCLWVDEVALLCLLQIIIMGLLLHCESNSIATTVWVSEWVVLFPLPMIWSVLKEWQLEWFAKVRQRDDISPISKWKFYLFGNLFLKNWSGGQSEIPCTKIWSTSQSEGTPPLKQLQISWKFHV